MKIDPENSSMRRIHAQERRLARAVLAGADHANLLVGHLVAIADGAVAQQPA